MKKSKPSPWAIAAASATPLAFVRRLTDNDPCAEAQDWLRSVSHLSMSDAYHACPRGDWLVWLAEWSPVDNETFHAARSAYIFANDGHLGGADAVRRALPWPVLLAADCWRPR